MVRKARLFRGSIVVFVVVTFAIIYIFPRDYGAFKLWKRIPYHLEEDGPVVNPILESIHWNIQSKDMCDYNSSLALAIVLSSVENFSQRDFIRQTWANPDLHNFTRVRTIFILGLTNNTTLQQQVEEEALTYEDILQISVMDSYRNLTYKTTGALLWIHEWCNNLPWIVKVDDDVIVNPFNLRRFLESEILRKPKLLNIYGRVRRNSRPYKSGKWAVRKKEYKGVFYPTFILGSAYIIGRNCIDRLIAHIPYTQFLWLEDVFTTGLVARKSGLRRTSIEKIYFVTSLKESLIKGRAVFLVGEEREKFSEDWNHIAEYYKIPNAIDNG